MIFASSTGSSGHSLSANGPILHPTLDCGVLNFLAPRTLAFRPLILPVSTDQPMLMGLTNTSKADEVDIHLDGTFVGKLKKQEMIKVKTHVCHLLINYIIIFSGIKSRTSFPCIQLFRNNCRLEPSIIKMFKLESTFSKHIKSNKIKIKIL
jgi:hypothetical protein